MQYSALIVKGTNRERVPLYVCHLGSDHRDLYYYGIIFISIGSNYNPQLQYLSIKKIKINLCFPHETYLEVQLLSASFTFMLHVYRGSSSAGQTAHLSVQLQ